MRASTARPFSRAAGPSGYDPESVGRRVLSGRRLHPWYRLTARRLVLVASDIDADAGIAAVWLVRHPKSPGPVLDTWLYERGSSGWRWLGGGSSK